MLIPNFFQKLFFLSIFYILILVSTALATSVEESLQKVSSALKTKDYATAANILTPLAEQGITKAQFVLGYLYHEGLGVEQNHEKACDLYQKVGEKGDPKAQRMVGICYIKLKNDKENALIWFKKASDQGDEKAWFYLMKLGADVDVPESQFILGTLYEEGKGTKKNINEALKWYQKAAENGHAKAQFSLGYFYERGNHIEQDYGKAFDWYMKSAIAGLPQGQFLVAVAYTHGMGTSKNLMQAVDWFQKAAAQKYVKAYWELGIAYENGWGVEQNVQEAEKWYELSRKNGYTR